MCISPGVLPDGTEIACRKCRLCRDNAVNDWVGRCIAESKSVPASHCLTFTYGRDQDETSPFYGSEDHPRAKVLTYSDVQKFFKLLKRHGYPCRYFVVGEYGSTKGRAHWHVVAFWLDAVPAFAGFNSFGTWSDKHLSRGFDEKDKVRFMWHRLDDDGKPVFYHGNRDKPAYWWPHGWTEVSEASHGGIRYNTKYIQKDIGKAERQGHLMMSKKPPLGTAYFMRQAEAMVKQGITLRDLFYTFDEARTGKGELIQFRLKPPVYSEFGCVVGGRLAHNFIEYYISLWWEHRAKGRNAIYRREYEPRWLPHSEFLEEWLDKVAARSMVREYGTLDWRERYPDIPRPTLDERRVWMSTRALRWNKEIRAWQAPGPPGRDTRMYWKWIQKKEAYGWREVAIGDAELFERISTSGAKSVSPETLERFLQHLEVNHGWTREDLNDFAQSRPSNGSL